MSRERLRTELDRLRADGVLDEEQCRRVDERLATALFPVTDRIGTLTAIIATFGALLLRSLVEAPHLVAVGQDAASDAHEEVRTRVRPLTDHEDVAGPQTEQVAEGEVTTVPEQPERPHVHAAEVDPHVPPLRAGEDVVGAGEEKPLVEGQQFGVVGNTNARRRRFGGDSHWP
jgi:hypothetical protein